MPITVEAGKQENNRTAAVNVVHIFFISISFIGMAQKILRPKNLLGLAQPAAIVW